MNLEFDTQDENTKDYIVSDKKAGKFFLAHDGGRDSISCDHAARLLDLKDVEEVKPKWQYKGETTDGKILTFIVAFDIPPAQLDILRAGEKLKVQSREGTKEELNEPPPKT